MNHLICFGNELHGDDGFGPAVYRRLVALEPAPGWSLFEAGSRGLDTLGLFESCEQAIIVDAAAPAGSPGRLLEPKADDIDENFSPGGHGAGVGYLLHTLAAIDRHPRLRIVAVEMAAVKTFHIGLSAPVQQAVDRVIPLLCQWMGMSGES